MGPNAKELKEFIWSLNGLTEKEKKDTFKRLNDEEITLTNFRRNHIKQKHFDELGIEKRISEKILMVFPDTHRE